MKSTILRLVLLFVAFSVAGCGTLKFVTACSKGDAATVSAMIASNSSIVNSEAFNNPPPLAYAATPAIVDTLVAHGADVNLTFHGLSVLDWIAQGIPGGGATYATFMRLLVYGAHYGDSSITEAGRVADSANNAQNANASIREQRRYGKLNTPSGRPEITLSHVTSKQAMVMTIISYFSRFCSLVARTDSSLSLLYNHGSDSSIGLVDDFKFVQRDTGTTIYALTRAIYPQQGGLDTSILDDHNGFEYAEKRLEMLAPCLIAAELTLPYVTKRLAIYEAIDRSEKFSAARYQGFYQPALRTDTSLRMVRAIPEGFMTSASWAPLFWLQNYKFVSHDSGTTVFLTTSLVTKEAELSAKRWHIDTTVVNDQEQYNLDSLVLKWIDTACRVPAYKTMRGWYDNESISRRMDSVIDARIGDPRYTLPDGGLILTDSTQRH